ncbi:oligoribonuclease [Patescibacteria group bacterium]
MSKKQIIKKLVWIDLEMTGLDPVKHRIVEIAVIITDPKLKVIAQMYPIIIHQSQKRLDKMNDEVTKILSKSGLINKIIKSKVSLKEAEVEVMKFVRKYVKKKESPLCGSTIAQDRAFLQLYMPKFFDYLHHRTIDVSTLKQLYLNWHKKPKPFVKEKDTHRALDDIVESIEELKYYRRKFLKLK